MIPTQNIGDLREAETAYAEAIGIFEGLWPETDLTLACIRYNVGRIRMRMNELDTAYSLLRKSLETRLKALGEAHSDTAES